MTAQTSRREVRGRPTEQLIDRRVQAIQLARANHLGPVPIAILLADATAIEDHMFGRTPPPAAPVPPPIRLRFYPVNEPAEDRAALLRDVQASRVLDDSTVAAIRHAIADWSMPREAILLLADRMETVVRDHAPDWRTQHWRAVAQRLRDLAPNFPVQP